MLGIYIHTHWCYGHPYAARTWTLTDWEGFLAGLASLGYDQFMLWPMLDSMPAVPTPSDIEFLQTIHRVIDLAHQRFAMQVAIVVCANTMGNDKAADFAYQERPYFLCERKINPSNPQEVSEFLAARARAFEPLAQADRLVIIDSDPGGYIGSTNQEFVTLAQGQIDRFRRFNQKAGLDYWMLYGWETYNRFWARVAASTDEGQLPEHPSPSAEIDVAVFVETLSLLRDQVAEPWGVYVWLDEHFEATDRLGMTDKRVYFPYGLIEFEPSFPLIEYSPDSIAQGIAQRPAAATPRGLMGNAQSHCLQLPHLYLFAHFGQGKSTPTVDLAGFGDLLLPGLGATLSEAWQALTNSEPGAQRSLAKTLSRHRGGPHQLGPASGLLFGDADRFLGDLADNLLIRAALQELDMTIVRDGSPGTALRDFLECFGSYQRRIGFVDAYGGTLHRLLNEPLSRLGDPRIDRVLGQFNDWRDPSLRHHTLKRLLKVIEGYA